MADEQAHTLPMFGDDQVEVAAAPVAPVTPAAPASIERETLLMIMDGHAMVHRSFRAISTQRHLTVNATGEDVTGVYGFANVFLRALNEWNPAYCAIAFDMSAPTFRHKQFPEYKAQRESTPEELRPQFGRVKQLMEAFGVAVFELEGWEADDVIGTLSVQAEKMGLDSVILTGDRDTFQLISLRSELTWPPAFKTEKFMTRQRFPSVIRALLPHSRPISRPCLATPRTISPVFPKLERKRPSPCSTTTRILKVSTSILKR